MYGNADKSGQMISIHIFVNFLRLSNPFWNHGIPCLANIELSAPTWLCSLVHSFHVSWEVVRNYKVVNAFQLEEVCGYDLPGTVLLGCRDKLLKLVIPLY